MRYRIRHALTLIELLVVIAILGMLSSLILAAVQRARGAAARVMCANNLRQLGFALHQYHDAMQTFPSGMRWRRGTDPYPMMSWLTQVLPYVEQEELWRVTRTAYQKNRWPLNNPPHVGLATVLKVFVCPSDERVTDKKLALRSGIEVAFTSYLGVEGKSLRKRDGMLFQDSRIRVGDVMDGTSNTLLVGERPPSTDFQFGWWYAGAGQAFTGSADMILGVREENVLPFSVVQCIQGEYRFGPGDLRNQCAMFHFWSLHNGGGNFLFGDGSVRFLAYSADPIMPALATRGGGEAVTIPD
jgi:prepilin-type N-terminal cleavage/methylation domain-containing protein/prepilin-type processing-associated H-X9-DG protein